MENRITSLALALEAAFRDTGFFLFRDGDLMEFAGTWETVDVNLRDIITIMTHHWHLPDVPSTPVLTKASGPLFGESG